MLIKLTGSTAITCISCLASIVNDMLKAVYDVLIMELELVSQTLLVLSERFDIKFLIHIEHHFVKVLADFVVQFIPLFLEIRVFEE